MVYEPTESSFEEHHSINEVEEFQEEDEEEKQEKEKKQEKQEEVILRINMILELDLLE